METPEKLLQRAARAEKTLAELNNIFDSVVIEGAPPEDLATRAAGFVSDLNRDLRPLLGCLQRHLRDQAAG